jgi:hypothetical protein
MQDRIVRYVYPEAKGDIYKSETEILAIHYVGTMRFCLLIFPSDGRTLVTSELTQKVNFLCRSACNFNNPFLMILFKKVSSKYQSTYNHENTLSTNYYFVETNIIIVE